MKELIFNLLIQLIVATGTITAAHLTIKGTVKKELLHLKFAKAEKLDEDFSKMCQSVTASLDSQNKHHAQYAVSALLGRFDGTLASTLDDLYNSLKYHDPIKTQALLFKAVKDYRQLVFGNTNSKTSIFRRSSK